MARADRGDGPQDGSVEFEREDDGTVTARDTETGLARGGETRAEALKHLAEVLALAAGEGKPIEDPDSFLREQGIDPDELDGDRDVPEFMR